MLQSDVDRLEDGAAAAYAGFVEDGHIHSALGFFGGILYPDVLSMLRGVIDERDAALSALRTLQDSRAFE